jgi:NAD-dependent deacetylase sirtuin 2
LERVAGIPAEKLVEAHGTFFTAHCLDCRKEYDLEFVKGKHFKQSFCFTLVDLEIIFKDEIPHCTSCNGIIKPGIIL